MHIAARSAVPTQPPSTGKFTEVPPGLARRGLALPPGISKKLESSDAYAVPEGIAKRFLAQATPPTPENTQDVSTPSGDELSIGVTAVSLDITV
jgi:hypothetical protein